MVSGRRRESAAGGKTAAASACRTCVEWRERQDRPLYAVTIWPNRSLTPGVRKAVLGAVALGLSLPMPMLVGTLAFWGMLPFVATTLALVWLGLRLSDRDRTVVEQLTLWRDEMRVERREPTGRCLRWTAEPLKVRLCLHAQPIENYLTLTGGGREIELGAFLSPDERAALAEELEDVLTRAMRA